MEIRNTPKNQLPEDNNKGSDVLEPLKKHINTIIYAVLGLFGVFLLIYFLGGESEIERYSERIGIEEMRSKKQYAKALEVLDAAILNDSLQNLRQELIALKTQIQEEAKEDLADLTFDEFLEELDSLEDYYAYPKFIERIDQELKNDRYNSSQNASLNEKKAFAEIHWDKLEAGKLVLLPRDYRVQSGETLSGIAQRAGMSLSEVRKKNNLKKDNIMEGQILRLQDSVMVSKHRVRSGEALSIIAGKYSMSLRDIRRLNQLKTDALNAGKDLLIFKEKNN